MVDFCCPFRLKAPIENKIIRDYGVKPIVSASINGSWGISNGEYGAIATFNHVEEKIRAIDRLLGPNHPIHIHPIICRSERLNGGNPKALKNNIKRLAMPALSWYADRASGVTLCQELIAFTELWPEIKGVYAHVREIWPDLKLYAGHHAIRSEADRKLCIDFCLYLDGLLDGFVAADYHELSPDRDHLMAPYVETGRAAAMTLLKDFAYLSDFARRLKALDIKPVIETAVKADNDTAIIRIAQARIYNKIWQAINRQDSEMWIWWLSDEWAYDFQTPGRKMHTGIFDETGNKRLSSVNFLKEIKNEACVV